MDGNCASTQTRKRARITVRAREYLLQFDLGSILQGGELAAIARNDKHDWSGAHRVSAECWDHSVVKGIVAGDVERQNVGLSRASTLAAQDRITNQPVLISARNKYWTLTGGGVLVLCPAGHPLARAAPPSPRAQRRRSPARRQRSSF